MASKTEPVAKVPKKTELERYTQLVAEKSRLESEARKLDKEISAMKSALILYAESVGGETERCGFRIAAVEGGKYPAWKQEFETRLGALAVQEVIDATITSVKLIVERFSQADSRR